MRIFLNGGGAEDKTKEANKKLNSIIDHTKPILYIPLAMTKDKYDSCYEWIMGELKEVKVPHIEMIRSVEELSEKAFDNYSAIFIGGGNTFKLLTELKQNSIFDRIKDYINNNGIVFGGSAGTIIFGEDLESCFLDDSNDVQLTDINGFNILNGISFLCHYTNRTAEKVAESTEYLLELSKRKKIIALPEEDTLYINDDKIEVIGNRPWYIFENGRRIEMNPTNKSINYFCSGFDINNAFWDELAYQLKKDLKATKRIVYIPGSTKENKIEKAKNVYIPSFTEHFKKIGIEFENIECITPDMSEDEAKGLVLDSNMVFLLGGNPFLQQELYTSKGLTSIIQDYNGVIMGMSAGAMNMSKYIIITPCSEEYPSFDIRPGLNLSNISIYPHNNFEGTTFPSEVDLGGELTKSNDLIQVAKEYGTFYCLQDYLDGTGKVQVSLIRTCGDDIKLFTNNNGKIWEVSDKGFKLLYSLNNEITEVNHNNKRKI